MTTMNVTKTSRERPDWGHGKDNKLMHEVLPGLWQGGTHDDDVVGNPRFATHSYIIKKDFDTVITMYQYANPVGWFVNEYRYCIYDADIESIDLHELFKTARYAYNEWSEGKRVLIRCQAGWNRSGLITALVLMLHGVDAKAAIELIRNKRSSHALCNPEFEDFLLSLDPDLIRG